MDLKTERSDAGHEGKLIVLMRFLIKAKKDWMESGREQWVRANRKQNAAKTLRVRYFSRCLPKVFSRNAEFGKVVFMRM